MVIALPSDIHARAVAPAFDAPALHHRADAPQAAATGLGEVCDAPEVIGGQREQQFVVVTAVQHQALLLGQRIRREFWCQRQTLEIDAVIDPADTRAWLMRGLESAHGAGTAVLPYVDTW